MPDWVKRVLTRHVRSKGKQVIVLEPDEKLVYAVKFSLGMTACLSALEVASMAFLGKWNNEVFAGITGLIGTVTGILVGQKA
jgi:hypothetical protein